MKFDFQNSVVEMLYKHISYPNQFNRQKNWFFLFSPMRNNSFVEGRVLKLIVYFFISLVNLSVITLIKSAKHLIQIDQNKLESISLHMYNEYLKSSPYHHIQLSPLGSWRDFLRTNIFLLSKHTLCQVWWKLAQWFWRRRFLAHLSQIK